MTTKPAKSPLPTPEEWAQLQSHYLDAWLLLMRDMTQASAENKTNASDKTEQAHWSESLELWWDALSSSLAPENHDVFRKFLDQGKSYFRVNGEFLKVFQSLQTINSESPEWQQLWNTSFEELKAHFLATRTQQNETFGFWEMPLDNWQRILSALSMIPSDLLEHLKEDVIASERQRVNTKLEQLLSMPGIGYTREWQEQFQQGVRLWLNYQNAQQDYATQFQRIGLRTIDLLREHMELMQQRKETITDLRALYNIWVDCGEAAYAEHVSTTEFITVYARLINSLMAWKRHEQKVIDNILTTFHMPTQNELNTVNLRVHQLRRENKLLQTDSNSAHMIGLIQEVNMLRAELNELRTQVLLDNKKSAEAITIEETVKEKSAARRKAKAKITASLKPPSSERTNGDS